MQRYPFLRFATKVLKFIGWAVLLVGTVVSIVVGVMMGGSPDGGPVGAALGVFVAIGGAIVSFLSWLFFLSTRELFYLLMQVEENTRNTADRITLTEKSSSD